MEKSLVLVLILGSLAFLLVATDFNSDEYQVSVSEEKIDNNINSTDDSKSNESQQNLKLSKTYNKNGIYFNYPNDWGDDWINNILSLGFTDNLGNENFHLMVFVDDSSIDQRLELEKENKISLNYSKYAVDGKKAYLVSSIDNDDIYSFQLIIEKNPFQSYFLELYCDKEYAKEGKELFMEIIKTIRIQ